jgi:hypothetical protein
MPPSYEQHLGDAAVYADAAAVAEAARQLWQDPEAFAAQQLRGHAWAERALGPDAFRRRLGAAGGLQLDDRKESS